MKGVKLIQRTYLIPVRTEYALRQTIYTSPWAISWQRIYRQVFWLSDGNRDTQRIARLLHKGEQTIIDVVTELTVNGYVQLLEERKMVTMNPPLLKKSFEMIVPCKEAFSRSFYEKLFRDYPATKALFADTDMPRQESSLMATLAVVVAGVERGENVVPILRDLGAKHKKYGAQAEHYPLVGSVLIATFHEYLHERFTPEMQSSWSQAFEIISGQMLEGARQEV